MQIPVVRNILEANEKVAEELKSRFEQAKVLVLNLMSSPGAGKTTTLEKTLQALKDELKMAVIEGDLQTSNDAKRVAATGVQAVQINTDGGCHLDANMVWAAVKKLDLTDLDVLFVENVGNLVCPAEFSVGEDYKITILSVTEGDDKPEKYPLIFAESRVMLLNKIDLLPYVDFNLDKAINFARMLNPKLEVIPYSARTEEGIDKWYNWLRQEVKRKKQTG